MRGPFVNNLEGECPHSVWFAGCKIPKSSYYPERAWGACLPGDEPGWNCDKKGDACPGEMHWSECPRIEKSHRFCPVCFEEGRVSALEVDPEDPGLPHHCPNCDAHWADKGDLDDEWTELVLTLQDTGAFAQPCA